MKTICPNCGGKLSVQRLVCDGCQAEYPVSQGLSPYDHLNEDQAKFLELYLRSQGSLKAVGEALNLSYPAVKRRFDQLLTALGYLEEKEYVPMNFAFVKKNESSNNSPKLVSEVIRQKLIEAGCAIDIPEYSGELCRVVLCDDGNHFASDKLGNYSVKYNFDIFDCIIDILRSSDGYRVRKGTGRGKNKVGYGNCTEDTVIGALAIRYFGKTLGESTYDPNSVLFAVLDWAGVAKNQRGYLQLNPEYI